MAEPGKSTTSPSRAKNAAWDASHGGLDHEIARRVGASRATFYLHFRGKEEIAAALAEETWRIVADCLERLVDLPDWSRDSVLRWIEEEDESWPRIATVTSITRHPGSNWEMDLARRAE